MIVWSLEPSRDAVLESITAGAHGFLHKEISPTGLMRALRGTVNGEAPLSRDMAALMIDAIHTLEARSKARERAAVLSEREKEVLAFVARGARNREIAEELTISEFTVKRHMQNILQKLDVAFAARRGRVLRLGVPRRSGRRREVGMSERETPLVAVICAVPLLGEAVTGALEGLAECKFIPARQPELGGLLKSLQPDAIVVDERAGRRRRGDVRPVRAGAGDLDLAAREHGPAARGRPLGLPGGTWRLGGVDPQPRRRRDLRPPGACANAPEAQASTSSRGRLALAEAPSGAPDKEAHPKG